MVLLIAACIDCIVRTVRIDCSSCIDPVGYTSCSVFSNWSPQNGVLLPSVGGPGLNLLLLTFVFSLLLTLVFGMVPELSVQLLQVRRSLVVRDGGSTALLMLVKCVRLPRKCRPMLYMVLPWRPVRTTLVTFVAGTLPLLRPTLQHLGWRTKVMTLVLRLTVFDLWRLESRGCPELLCTLAVWSSRDSVTTGMPSLPVTVPSACETKVILRLWPFPELRPLATSRRQLTTTTPTLRRTPRWWVPEWNLKIESVGALLTQSGVSFSGPAVDLRRCYRLGARWFDPMLPLSSFALVTTKCTTSRMVDTLSEKNVMFRLRLIVTPWVTESMNVAPFTEGCVVTTTRLESR